MDSLTAITITFILLLLSLLYLSWKIRTYKRTNTPKAPEPAGAWPLLGHLHLLNKPGLPPHITLGAISDKYGPIFTIRLGMRQALVVSSWEVAKQCSGTNDTAFASRPKALAVKIMGYNYATFGLSPDLPYWRELRKFFMREIVSSHRLNSLKHIRNSEIETSMKELYGNIDNTVKPVLVDMKQWFQNLTFNLTVRMISGKRYFGSDTKYVEVEGEAFRCNKALGDFFELLGVVAVSDTIPFLGWLDNLKGYKKAMKKTGKELDCLLQGWLEEHKEKRSCGEKKADEVLNLMDVILSFVEDGKVSNYGYDGDTITKATCLVFLSGAVETTSVTLTWALSLLLNNPHALKKAQHELDMHVGKRKVEEQDIKNLVYLQAIIKETFRLYPAGQLIAPRESIEDCTVAGYHIPAGTRLIVNLWKIHRDPSVWSNPCEFQPERFLTSHAHVDFKGQHFELLPFGFGRRICPGLPLAVQIVNLTLARLLHEFEFKTVLDEAVDMSEISGLTNAKATPLEVLITPRLP